MLETDGTEIDEDVFLVYQEDPDVKNTVFILLPDGIAWTPTAAKELFISKLYKSIFVQSALQVQGDDNPLPKCYLSSTRYCQIMT